MSRNLGGEWRRSPYISDREHTAIAVYLLSSLARIWEEQLFSGEETGRLNTEFRDAAALLADIGMEVTPAPRVGLTLPRRDLRRIFTWLGQQARDGLVESQVQKELIEEASNGVLAALDHTD